MARNIDLVVQRGEKLDYMDERAGTIFLSVICITIREATYILDL